MSRNGSRGSSRPPGGNAAMQAPRRPRPNNGPQLSAVVVWLAGVSLSFYALWLGNMLAFSFAIVATWLVANQVTGEAAVQMFAPLVERFADRLLGPANPPLPLNVEESESSDDEHCEEREVI
jgi:hypothetical protein